MYTYHCLSPVEDTLQSLNKPLLKREKKHSIYNTMARHSKCTVQLVCALELTYVYQDLYYGSNLHYTQAYSPTLQ